MIFSRFNGLNPLLDEVPSFLGNRKTKEILKVTYLVSDAQASVNSGGAIYSITSSGEHTDLLSI